MILGIDPGVRKIWYAIIDFDKTIVKAGILLQNIEKPNRMDYFQRIQNIKVFFEKIQKDFVIDCVCIEKLFFTKFNQKNAEFVFGIRAILISMFLDSLDWRLFEYSPIELKKNITWNGNANKELVMKMIQQIYNLTDFPDLDDACDALGLAYLGYTQTK